MTLPDSQNAGGPPSRQFRLDKQNGKVWGVCAGIAQYFQVDPMWVRVLFVVGTLIGFGSFLLIYLATGLIAD